MSEIATWKFLPKEKSPAWNENLFFATFFVKQDVIQQTTKPEKAHFISIKRAFHIKGAIDFSGSTAIISSSCEA